MTAEYSKAAWQERRSGSDLRRAESDYRDAYNRDRARVIHSAAFRRLQAKTQVLGIGEGDFHRTRLTHSMEVAQIARGIVRYLKDKQSSGKEWAEWLPDPNLIETIALAHDLGHPPFGHGGEVALNYAMRDAGGFEGNGQTLRLLARLEAHTDGFGLDLSRRSLLGILKYPVPHERVVRQKLSPAVTSPTQLNREKWKPPKCFMATETDVFEWIIDPFSGDDRAKFVSLKLEPTEMTAGKSQFHGFDTGIMELADDIAYGVHDFEDAIALRMIHKADWAQLAEFLDHQWGSQMGIAPSVEFGVQLFEAGGAARKRAIGALVNAFIVSIRVREEKFEHPLLKHQATMIEPAEKFLGKLKDLVVRQVIKTPQVQTLEYRGQQLILHLFEALSSDPTRLLKENFSIEYSGSTESGAKARVICDYIAGMTDEYATRLYERLFLPRHGQFSDRL